jgi:hypothetical protein
VQWNEAIAWCVGRQSRHCRDFTGKVVYTFALGVKIGLLRTVAAKVVIPFTLRLKWSFAMTCSGIGALSAKARRAWPGLFVYYCFNYTPSSITAMPLAGKYFLFCFLVVEAILEGRGA